MKQPMAFMLIMLLLILAAAVHAQEQAPEKLTKEQMEKISDEELIKIAEKLDTKEVAKLSAEKIAAIINHMGDNAAKLPAERLNEEKITKVLNAQTITVVHDKIDDITRLPHEELKKAFAESMEIGLELGKDAKEVKWQGGSLVTKKMGQDVENLGAEFVTAKVDNEGNIVLVTDRKTEIAVSGKGIVNKGDTEHPVYESKDQFIVKAVREDALAINGKQITMQPGSHLAYKDGMFSSVRAVKITDPELGVTYETKAGDIDIGRTIAFGRTDEPASKNAIHVGKEDGELVVRGTGDGRLILLDKQGNPHTAILFEDGKPFVDRELWLQNKDKALDRSVTINDMDIDDLGVKTQKSRVSFSSGDARERINTLLDKRMGNMRDRILETAKTEFAEIHGRAPTESELDAELQKKVEKKVAGLIAVNQESIHKAAVESIKGKSEITFTGEGITFSSIEEAHKAEEAAMKAMKEHLSMDNFNTRGQMLDFLTRLQMDEKKSFTNLFDQRQMSTLDKVKLWRAVTDSQDELATVQGFFQRRVDDPEYKPSESDVKELVQAQQKLAKLLGTGWETVVSGQLHVGLLSGSNTYQDAVGLTRKADSWIATLGSGIRDTYSTGVSRELMQSMLTELKDYSRLGLDKNPQLLDYYLDPETRTMLLSAAEKKPVTVYDKNQKLSFLRFADTLSVTDEYGEVVGRLAVEQKSLGVYELTSHSLDLPRGKNDFRVSASLVDRIMPEKYSAMKELFDAAPGETKAEMLKSAIALVGNSPESIPFSLDEARRLKEVGVHTPTGGIGGLFEKLMLLKKIEQVPEEYGESARTSAENARGQVQGTEVPIPTDSSIEVRPRDEQYATIRAIAQISRDVRERDIWSDVQKLKSSETGSLLEFAVNNKNILPFTDAQKAKVITFSDYVSRTAQQHPELDQGKLRAIADDAIAFALGPALNIAMPMEQKHDVIYFSSDGRVLMYINGKVKVYPSAYAEYIKGMARLAK